MGCTNFFKYHPDATLSDYAKRFGYDANALERAVRKTVEYRERPFSDEQIVLKEALLSLDARGLTDILYERQKIEQTLPYMTTQSAVHSEFSFIPITTQTDAMSNVYVQTNTQYAMDATAYRTTEEQRMRMYEALYESGEDDADETSEETRDVMALLLALQIIDDERIQIKTRDDRDQMFKIFTMAPEDIMVEEQDGLPLNHTD